MILILIILFFTWISLTEILNALDKRHKRNLKRDRIIIKAISLLDDQKYDQAMDVLCRALDTNDSIF